MSEGWVEGHVLCLACGATASIATTYTFLPDAAIEPDVEELDAFDACHLGPVEIHVNVHPPKED